MKKKKKTNKEFAYKKNPNVRKFWKNSYVLKN